VRAGVASLPSAIKFDGVTLYLGAGKLHGVPVALAPFRIQPGASQIGRDGRGGLVLCCQDDFPGVISSRGSALANVLARPESFLGYPLSTAKTAVHAA
jgi:hypothetical protein